MVEAITTFITIIEYKFPRINSYRQSFATFGFKLGFKLCVAISCVQVPEIPMMQLQARHGCATLGNKIYIQIFLLKLFYK